MESEDEQLTAMARFLKGTGLDRPLGVLDWTSFARGYNGPDFARNLYDAKLAAAYQRYQHPLCRTSRFAQHRCCCPTPGSIRLGLMA
jgi:hypothetical protein